MIQISGLSSSERSIHNVLVIKTEEVKVSEALPRLVHDLPLVCYDISDELAHILSHDLSSVDRLSGEESILMNPRWSDCNFLRILNKVTVFHCNGKVEFFLSLGHFPISSWASSSSLEWQLRASYLLSSCILILSIFDLLALLFSSYILSLDNCKRIGRMMERSIIGEIAEGRFLEHISHSKQHTRIFRDKCIMSLVIFLLLSLSGIS